MLKILVCTDHWRHQRIERLGSIGDKERWETWTQLLQLSDNTQVLRPDRINYNLAKTLRFSIFSVFDAKNVKFRIFETQSGNSPDLDQTHNSPYVLLTLRQIDRNCARSRRSAAIQATGVSLTGGHAALMMCADLVPGCWVTELPAGHLSRWCNKWQLSQSSRELV